MSFIPAETARMQTEQARQRQRVIARESQEYKQLEQTVNAAIEEAARRGNRSCGVELTRQIGRLDAEDPSTAIIDDLTEAGYEVRSHTAAFILRYDKDNKTYVISPTITW